MRTVLAALLAIPAVGNAQVVDTARLVTLTVRVEADSAPVMAARVRAADVSATTDREGSATLRLRAGTYRITTTRLGFAPDSLTVSLAGDTLVTITLQAREAMLENVIVSATRAERRIEDTPLKVEVLPREEIEEKMLMTPGDITMMLNETGGLRVQTTSPSLGGANVRVQGLRGRYTLLLSDGLPLFGGQSGTLSLLQIPPMDLGQVEVIKGVASALYGSAALGGVINLVSRRPEDEPEREVLLNQTTRQGHDVVGWASRQTTPSLGYTMLAGVHTQRRVDIDDDGWTDMPGYERVVARPRLFWGGENGRSAMFTVGTTFENRRGGTPAGMPASNGVEFVEALRTRRYDGGSVIRVPFSRSVWSLRLSASGQGHEHRFGTVRERDKHLATLVETSVASTLGSHTTVVGAVWQFERYAPRDVTVRFGYQVPAIFAQYDLSPNDRVALSASARGDLHSERGAYFNPRLSALFRGTEDWTLRISVGSGTFMPTFLTEETEATGITPVRLLTPLGVERATNASLDFGKVIGRVELNLTAFTSRVFHPLLARASTTGTSELILFHGDDATTTTGGDMLLRLKLREITSTATYTLVSSTEQDPEGPGRRRVPLTPRLTAGLVSVWEREDVGRVGVEYYYTGRQALGDNPYRPESVPYSIYGAIGEWHIGAARLFLNLENVGNVRLTRYHPLVRPFPGMGGRWTTDAWAPLEGRVVNGGVRLRF